MMEHEFAAARRALDAFGVPGEAEVTFVKHRENHVYRVRAPGMDRALRMHRVGYRTDEELRSETASVAMFRERGLLVPQPHEAPTGGYLVVVRDDQGGLRQATMQEWVPDAVELGQTPEVFEGRSSPDDARLRGLGVLIARMHDAAAAGAPAGYTRAAWDERGLAGPHALWGRASRLASLTANERRILDESEARVARELGALPKTADAFGVIHADYTFENVLSTDDGLVLLDFDDSGEGWYLFDLTTPVFWFSRHPRGAELSAAVLAGYRTVRPAFDARGWHALLMARALSYLGWAADRPGDPTSDFHEQTMAPWVLDAARRFVETGDTGWPSVDPAKGTS